HHDAQLVGAYSRSTQRDKRQMAANQSFLDRAELGRIVLDVNVDVLKLADLLAFPIDHRLATPLRDVPRHVLLILAHLLLPAFLRRSRIAPDLPPRTSVPRQTSSNPSSTIRVL